MKFLIYNSPYQNKKETHRVCYIHFLSNIFFIINVFLFWCGELHSNFDSFWNQSILLTLALYLDQKMILHFAISNFFLKQTWFKSDLLEQNVSFFENWTNLIFNQKQESTFSHCLWVELKIGKIKLSLAFAWSLPSLSEECKSMWSCF